MTQYIPKSAVVAEVKKRLKEHVELSEKCGIASYDIRASEDNDILSSLNALEAKEVGLIIYAVIDECCDWLALHTELSHDKIEDCRNHLMLIAKDKGLNP